MNGLFVAIFLLIMILVMIGLVSWARKRTTGAIATGALLSMFAPDPTLEASIRLREEAKQEQSEEDEKGEPKSSRRRPGNASQSN